MLDQHLAAKDVARGDSGLETFCKQVMEDVMRNRGVLGRAGEDDAAQRLGLEDKKVAWWDFILTVAGNPYMMAKTLEWAVQNPGEFAKLNASLTTKMVKEEKRDNGPRTVVVVPFTPGSLDDWLEARKQNEMKTLTMDAPPIAS
jgi:hypothetical protein